MASEPKILFGFHAVGVRLKIAPTTVLEVYVDPARRDARMRQFLQRAQEAGVRVIEADGARLARLRVCIQSNRPARWTIGWTSWRPAPRPSAGPIRPCCWCSTA
jgi:hypothetical protein